MFKRKIEDFVCENCGEQVRGSGFTNHCPRCLWSKHVDVEPGDRASQCGGLMEPIEYCYSVSEKWVLHRCVVCGLEKKNKLNDFDSLDALSKL
jgi:hypothetical protein